MAKAKKQTESAASGSASVIDTPPDTAHAAETAGGEHRDRVAMRAYELYLARGGADGGDFDDWLAAEREIGGGNGNSSRGDAGE